MTELPPFLRLAAETRNQIYGYLLSTKYTKHYSRELDPEWECHVDHKGEYWGTSRPTHTYRFHVGILGVNHQINPEARHVLEQNMFVKMISGITDTDFSLGWLGVPIVAKEYSSFCYDTVLRVYIKAGSLCYLEHFDGEAPEQIIFAGADMPAFCTALAYGGKAHGMVPISSLSTTLTCNTSGGDEQTRGSFSISRLKSLLEPLRFIHSFYAASITGPLDEQYKTDLSRSICKMAPTFQESLSEVEKKVREYGGLFDSQDPDDYHHVVRVYSNAMTELKDRCSRLDSDILPQSPVVLYSVADKKLQLHTEYITLVFVLQTGLANAYFQLGQYDQSRKWSARAMDIELDTWGICLDSHPDYARACLLNARSIFKLGRWEEAVDSMKEAVVDAPHLEEELKAFEEHVKRHEKRLKERRLETVRTVLAKNRSQNGRRLVIKYPEDFDKVMEELCVGSPDGN